ncbi:hypothetical protein EJ03DRAFT_336283 [Teratosphaeria nubilosa]|uniref:F-box domain-containing protein n=1 Tax=Teratosphaeria nubilosa TaxID=161662 RepID=A0A6G1LA05_9PEZI|nr:hypothetical protein EJ03DRAFT_336283 [Teratosphaeria nubilosa]
MPQDASFVRRTQGVDDAQAVDHNYELQASGVDQLTGRLALCCQPRHQSITPHLSRLRAQLDMLSFLDLPRELFISVCSYLAPTELTKVAGVSRDHYLAVQQPLYNRIQLTKYGNLVKLVHTLQRVPIVSIISLPQRQRWHRLSDEQLREREIKHLRLELDSRQDGEKITGTILATCLGAIARKCFSVKIELILKGAWPEFVKQLENHSIPNVASLTLYVNTHRSTRDRIWELLLSGSYFTDLRSLYLNTMTDSYDNLPTTLWDAIGFAEHSSNFQTQQSTAKPLGPFSGLRNMETILLHHVDTLNDQILGSLFCTDTIPKRLKRLEIVDCPKLHPIRDLKEIATLLRRSLQVVDTLKFHTCVLSQAEVDEGSAITTYANKIQNIPADHICNIIREVGQRVPTLDLALPYVCTRILQPPTKRPITHDSRKDYPHISYEPYQTLPQRMVEAGYRHRRLLSLHGICRDAHGWDELCNLAGEQKDDASWEMLFSSAEEDRGSWHVGGCLPVVYTADEVLQRPLGSN